MSPDLALPLQLAANLLALGAAAGFAAVVVLRVGASTPADERDPDRGRPSRPSATLLVLGSLALIAGHGLDGALVPDRGELVGWLLAGGLALVALGAAPARLPGAASASAGSAGVATPVVAPALLTAPPVSAAVVGAVAGGLAAVRLAFGGRSTVLVALALALWGAARALAPVDPTISAFCTIAGAVALGAWIWQAAASQLRAKLMVAFVATLLVLVATLALVLSARGAADLVAEEEFRLGESAATLADEIAGEWPARARADLGVVSGRLDVVETNLLGEGDGQQELEQLLTSIFTGQDVLALLDLAAGGDVLLAAPADVVDADLRAAIRDAAFVSELVAGAEQAGGAVRAGSEILGLGGVRVTDPDPQAETDARYALVAGQMTDPAWAESAAERLQVGVAVEANDQVGARSDVGDLETVLAELGAGPDQRAVTVGGATLLAAAEPTFDPRTGEQLGRVVLVRPGGTVAQLQRDQTRQLFVLALLGAVIGAAVAALVAGRVLSPVRRLTAAAAAVGRGRLDATAAVDTPDEIGTLGRTFDRMTASLAAQSRQLRDAADEQARLHARLEAVTASMSDGLVATDRDGRVTTLNRAAHSFVFPGEQAEVGANLEQMVVQRGGDPLWGAVGRPDEPAVHTARLLLAADHGRRLVPTDVTAAPVRDAEDRIVGRVLVLRDVTREAELERMKTEFLSNVSHELRTPLTPIRGFADVLARRDVGAEDARRFASQILDSAERMERVVGRIVDFAALDSGRMRARHHDLDVSELVDDVLAEWRRREPDRHFRRRLARTLPAVRTDASMLTRCLDELVDNAVKFSDVDDPILVTGDVEDGGTVRLSVRDRGVGLDPDRAAAVFGEFYQVDASETRHFEGLGLGLALVRRIVDELGGDATVESTPGQGAAFHLRLPTADSHAEG